MEFYKLKNYIVQLDSLIRMEHTGTADEFAKKLGVSERTLQNHIQQLRELGINIIYDYYKRSYRYAERGRLTFGFTPIDMSAIKGGKSLLHLLNSDKLKNRSESLLFY